MKTLPTIVLLSLNLIFTAENSETGESIFASHLSPGDTIMFVAPSGPLDTTRMNLARKRLEDRGYITIQSTELFESWGYLGGSDRRRAEEFMDAFKNKSVKAVFPGTGGYGTTRILDMLDYEVIGKNPKILIGFSDITGLHLAINKMTNLITFHTPNPMYGLGSKDNLSPISETYFWKAIEQETPNEYTIDLGPFGLKDSVIVIHP